MNLDLLEPSKFLNTQKQNRKYLHISGTADPSHRSTMEAILRGSHHAQLSLEVGRLREGIELRPVQAGSRRHQRLLLERAAAVTPLHILLHTANATLVPTIAVRPRERLVPRGAPVIFHAPNLSPGEAAAGTVLKPDWEVREDRAESPDAVTGSLVDRVVEEDVGAGDGVRVAEGEEGVAGHELEIGVVDEEIRRHLCECKSSKFLVRVEEMAICFDDR